MIPPMPLAMVMRIAGSALEPVDRPAPELRDHEVLLRVRACGVCRTDLHILDGELKKPNLPLILGHEIVGVVEAMGQAVEGVALGDRRGVPWLGGTCGLCRFCHTQRENLCDNPTFTGYDRDGGFQELVAADHRYTLPVPEGLDDLSVAPFLCAGMVGYRSFRFVEDAATLGIYGFGAAAHLVAQIARYQGRRVFAFVRPGDEPAKRFARSLGAEWAGDSTEACPVPLDGAIVFAPVGALVPKALSDLDKGGILVLGGIHMSDIPAFPYAKIWGERVIRSVANLTRADGLEFLAIAEKAKLQSQVESFALRDANEAIQRLRSGAVQGAAVLVP
jgi:alcohol dehydrogenase, propanol-preferring